MSSTLLLVMYYSSVHPVRLGTNFILGRVLKARGRELKSTELYFEEDVIQFRGLERVERFQCY